MIARVKSSMGCIAFVLLMHAIVFITHSPVLFVSAKHVRGSTSNTTPIDSLPQRELAEAETILKENKNKYKKEVLKAADKKEIR